MSRSKTKWAQQKSLSNIAQEQGEGTRMMRSDQRDFNEYTSPQQYRDEKTTYDRDVWSTGVLLYKLLTGIFPFSDQADKLVLNKIKYATFSFPTLQQTKPLQGFAESNLKKIGHLQFLSSEWKELLKKMMADRNQRITLQQLINHPIKQSYFSLKDIQDLNTAQPSLTNLFSAKTNHNNTFKKTWKINFQNQEEDDNELNPNITYQDLMINPPEQYQQDTPQEKILYRQNIRGTTIAQSKFEKQNNTRTINFRVHKTQFGMPIANSIKSIDQNQRHETVDPFRQRYKQEKQDSVITPISQPTQRLAPPMPLIVKDPPFILKFHYFKKSQWLGYVLNNAIGIIYADGQHVVGHNREEFRYIQDESVINSEVMINQAEVINLPPQSIKQSIYKNHPRFATFHKSIEGEYSLKQSKINNYKSQQVSTKEFHDNPSNFQFNPTKTIIANSLTGDKGLLSLGKQKATIYLKAIDYFGEREVKNTLDIWVDQFWKDGNIYVFLLNTGCWQVAFRQQKHFRIYAIDQYDLSWSRDNSSNDLTHSIRQLVKKYWPLAKNKKNTVQS